jgi:hypothetical protein
MEKQKKLSISKNSTGLNNNNNNNLNSIESPNWSDKGNKKKILEEVLLPIEEEQQESENELAE